jgi:hypothetical protein
MAEKTTQAQKDNYVASYRDRLPTSGCHCCVHQHVNTESPLMLFCPLIERFVVPSGICLRFDSKE